MKASFDKPLPVVPRPQDNSFRLTTTLSIESRNHLRQFILNALEEEAASISRDDWEAEKEAWLSSLLSALDALAENVATGGWLTGVRRSRKAGILLKTGRDSDTSAFVEKGAGSSRVSPATSTKGSSDSCGKTRNIQKSSVPEALAQLNRLLSNPGSPTPKPTAKHMVLTTGAFGVKNALPNEDSGFNLIPSNVGCFFSPDVFLLPRSGDNSGDQKVDGVVLYGLTEWDVNPGDTSDAPIRIVGGNFSFKGVSAVTQHRSLCTIIRVAVYVYLSLILEQHLLADSHVKLNLPKQRPPRALSPPVEFQRTDSSYSRSSRESTSSTGVWSFFTKKTESFLNRATGYRSDLTRRDSTHRDDAPMLQAPTHQRTRTFSFLPDSIPWAAKPRKPVDHFATGPPFRATVQRLQKNQNLFSTTAGIIFPLPSLLIKLAEKEDLDPGRRVTSAERAGLTSILGWEGREARGKGMAGIYGFVKQQELCVLYSEHVSSPTRSSSVANPSDTSSTSSAISTASTTTEVPIPNSTRCGGAARWMCFQYYSKQKGADKTLGETVALMCAVAADLCGNPGCHLKRGDHELRFIHAGVRITACVEDLEKPYDDDYIEMQESCQECGARTNPSRMSDGTFLLSFGKYLELLIYSPKIHTLHPPLCEHTQVGQVVSNLDHRMNILRHFSYRTHRITLSLSAVDDVFDVHIPRLQVTKTSAERPADNTTPLPPTLPNLTVAEAEDAKRVLRNEIRLWWQDVSDHMDRLEMVFVRQDDLRALLKSLPRLPSTDEAFEDFDVVERDATPKAANSGLPTVSEQASYFDQQPHKHTSTSSLSTVQPRSPANLEKSSSTDELPPTPQNMDILQLLTSLRHGFQREEQLLYGQLSRTPVGILNNVRRSFITSAKGALKRLSAWESKHLPKGAAVVPSLCAKQPSWWDSTSHAVPGGSVVIREGDWGSIIAFTLSSQDYIGELAGMISGKINAQSAPPPTPYEDSRPSMFSKPSYRLFSSSRPIPDPDDARVVWQEQEVCSAVISRKEHPRDPSAILSLRDVLRKGPPESLSALNPSRFAAPARVGTPPSAWAKPAVEINTQPAAGQVEVPDSQGVAGKILQEMDAESTSSSLGGTPRSMTPTSSMIFESHIRGRGISSLSNSTQSDATVQATSKMESQDSGSSVEKPESSDSKRASVTTTPSLAGSSFAGSFAQVMKYMLNAPDQRPSSLPIQKHGLLSLDSPAIDDRPHIKYDWTIGKRLKFSCTVYYAKQFDALRRRCNIENVFLKSMETSENWTAEGGKSKSNFWKTSDEKFIIKTLVNAWNVADLQVLLELAPSYFRYMDSTMKKPTILAKLLGFYTVEIRNLETGNTQAKADLLVMENLFYDKNIVKTFDLKGIQGRKVKASTNSTTARTTLFDGEWIEGQERALTLLHPHAKLVLQEAIKSDSDYLAKSNIMDYSLLLGIDAERKQIACGLVDTIGSYTFAKTLEYKAKQNLKAGKDVTVIPPNEYQERFVNAMDSYFLACPDKWSKPEDETKIISDPNLLPSVL